MPDIETRLDRIEAYLERFAGITGELARDVRALVEGLAGDRAAFRQVLRDLSGFVATAGLELNQLDRRLQRLAEITEAGFAGTHTLLGENNRQIAENNREMAENNRVIRQLLDILARGRGNGEGPPSR